MNSSLLSILSPTVLAGIALLALTPTAQARKVIHTPLAVTVQMNDVTSDGVGKSLGTVRISQTPQGLTFTPMLTNLIPGNRGFHVHSNGSCQPAPNKDGKVSPAEAAGPHLDPAATKTHQGPMGAGHMGDLPVLEVAADGSAVTPVTAPRLTLKDVRGKSLMIHLGDDNYTDTPVNGGGGARIACGVIP